MSAPPPSPPPPDDEPDDDDDETPASASRGGIDAFLTAIAPVLPELMADWRRISTKSTSSTIPSTGVAHLARIQAQLDASERRYLDALLSDPDTGDAVAADFASKDVAEVVALIRHNTPRAGDETRKTIDHPRTADTYRLLQARVMTVIGQLEPELRARLLRLAPRLAREKRDPEIREMIDALVPMSVDETAAWIREHIDALEKRFAS